MDPSSPDAMRELQEVASAQQLLASDPARALSLVRAGEVRYPSGYLREERRYVGVIALFKLGRLDEARAETARFVSDYPEPTDVEGPWATSLRIGQVQGPGPGRGRCRELTERSLNPAS